MLRLVATIVSVFSDLLRLGALYFQSSQSAAIAGGKFESEFGLREGDWDDSARMSGLEEDPDV